MGFHGPYGVWGIDFRLAACKASASMLVVSLPVAVGIIQASASLPIWLCVRVLKSSRVLQAVALALCSTHTFWLGSRAQGNS